MPWINNYYYDKRIQELLQLLLLVYFLGCRFTDVSTKQLTFSQQWSGAAHTGGMAYVCDDPNILFEIQADGSVNDDDIAANAALVQGTSSATLGISRVSLRY
jgi:hypothetical protein